MSDYRQRFDLYAARQRNPRARATRLLWALLAWTVVFLTGAGIMLVAWLALVGFMYVFGTR